LNKKYASFGLLLILLASVGISSYLSPPESLTGKIIEKGETVTIRVTVQKGATTLSDQAVEVPAGATAFQALDKTHSVEFDEFAGLGKLITSIDGFSQDGENYWIFFVNGKPATVGVDGLILTEDTEIAFKLLSSEESLELFKE